MSYVIQIWSLEIGEPLKCLSVCRCWLPDCEFRQPHIAPRGSPEAGPPVWSMVSTTRSLNENQPWYVTDVTKGRATDERYTREKFGLQRKKEVSASLTRNKTPGKQDIRCNVGLSRMTVVL
jgi:hypothetical protein